MTSRQQRVQGARASQPPTPGLCGIENLTDAEKTARITMIANDITAAITQIANLRNAGLLRDRNTKPIEAMIDMFADTDMRHRENLEIQLRKRERCLDMLHQKHREKLDELTSYATAEVSQLKRKVSEKEEKLRDTERRLADTELRYMAAVARNERSSEQQIGETRLARAKRRRRLREEDSKRRVRAGYEQMQQGQEEDESHPQEGA